MEKKEIPSTVEDILEWKTKTKKEKWSKSVEDYNKAYTESCGGNEGTDVLFSFLGIYAIGVWVYNKEKDGLFKREANKIKVSVERNGTYNQILCSKKFLLQLQKENVAGIEVDCLNACVGEFAKLYFCVGNLIPMWPGGNMLKGNQNKGFMDIPELFFSRYYEWYQILEKRENAYLKEMTNYIHANQQNFNSLEIFLNSVDSKEKYKKYIEHIVSIIKARSKEILSANSNLFKEPNLDI